MRSLSHLFANNKAWAERIRKQDPDFFLKLARQQTPQYLWIGCSDSRVPANQIVDLLPGEIFVHRNIANVVVHTDLNCLSVIQFAVDVLKVSHIIVCGHYGCGGVKAALRNDRVGLSDNWLRHVHDVTIKHAETLRRISDPKAAHDRLCEMNAIEQISNVAATTIVRDAWERGQQLNLHAWCYGIHDGLIRDLGYHIGSREEAQSKYDSALKGLSTPGRHL